MNAIELFNEIISLPNLFYCFDLNGVATEANCAILGGESCPVKEKIEDILSLPDNLSKAMVAYGTGDDNQIDGEELTYRYRKIRCCCDYRVKGRHAKDEQWSFLKDLDTESLQNIEKQVMVYKKARELYSTYPPESRNAF